MCDKGVPFSLFVFRIVGTHHKRGYIAGGFSLAVGRALYAHAFSPSLAETTDDVLLLPQGRDKEGKPRSNCLARYFDQVHRVSDDAHRMFSYIAVAVLVPLCRTDRSDGLDD